MSWGLFHEAGLNLNSELIHSDDLLINTMATQGNKSCASTFSPEELELLMMVYEHTMSLRIDKNDVDVYINISLTHFYS